MGDLRIVRALTKGWSEKGGGEEKGRGCGGKWLQRQAKTKWKKLLARVFWMRIMRLPRLSRSANRFFNKIDQAMRVGTCG
jgi:hypothetical protein